VGLILDRGELFLPVRRAAPPGAAVA
jgi:hypothetical protein